MSLKVSYNKFQWISGKEKKRGGKHEIYVFLREIIRGLLFPFFNVSLDARIEILFLGLFLSDWTWEGIAKSSLLYEMGVFPRC